MKNDEIRRGLTALHETMTAGFASTDRELATLRETMTAGFARTDHEQATLRETMTAGFARTDQEQATLRETMTAGFARADRYFELQHVQFIEFRDEVIGELGEIRSRLDGLTARVDRVEEEVRSLRGEFSTFREWASREFAEVRGELRELRRLSAAQSTEIEHLSTRVDRLEQRWGLGGTHTESTA